MVYFYFMLRWRPLKHTAQRCFEVSVPLVVSHSELRNKIIMLYVCCQWEAENWPLWSYAMVNSLCPLVTSRYWKTVLRCVCRVQTTLCSWWMRRLDRHAKRRFVCLCCQRGIGLRYKTVNCDFQLILFFWFFCVEQLFLFTSNLPLYLMPFWRFLKCSI